MQKLPLGRTKLMVGRVGFGALPIQRIGAEEAGRILRKANENGVNFYDTARAYTDSEEKNRAGPFFDPEEYPSRDQKPGQERRGLAKRY